MEKAFIITKLEVNTKDSGYKIESMVMESWSMLTRIDIKVIG